MAYRHLFFDLDNTLWDCDGNAKSIVFQLYERYNVGAWYASPDLFYQAYKENNDRLWRGYAQGKITKWQLNQERFAGPFLGKTEEVERLAAEFADDYKSRLVHETRVMPGTFELLDYLRQKRYHLYIISNGFVEMQYRKMEFSGLAPYFEKVFLSEEIQEHKPDKRFFDRVVMSVNARKADSLVIGDNFDVDIVGGRTARIDQVYYESVPRQSEMPFVPTYHIHSLLELKHIL
ncbi:MAG: YjjG family noncanonical pyrimidine nucleotidase [Paludibacteraceae bacterium]|nr:YjjG family noncanonical pyrimidine nucleotidase [Paludibacteraceae bacterium]